nr:hypothetical protein [Tanacetum cinerariifolium]
MKNPFSRCEYAITDLVEFFRAHQPISLELILIDDTLRVRLFKVVVEEVVSRTYLTTLSFNQQEWLAKIKRIFMAFRVVPIKLISYSFVTLFKVIFKFHEAFASTFKKVESRSAHQLVEHARKLTCFGNVVDPFLRMSRVNRLSIIPRKIKSRRVVCLSPEWNTHDVVWRNKVDWDTMSMDDLYSNLKVYESKVKGISSSSSSIQNMAFVSSLNNNSSSTNETVNTANGVSPAITQVNAAFSTNIDNLSDAVICFFFASQLSSPQLVHEDLEQIYLDDMKEMDLRWQMAMLTIRARRYTESSRRSVPVETTNFIALVSCDDKLENASKDLNKLIECQIVDNYKKGLRYENYNAVLPPYTGNFMPPTPDLSYTGLDEFSNKTVAENTKSSKQETKVVSKNDDVPIIEEYVSDDEEKNVTQPKIEKKQLGPALLRKSLSNLDNKKRLLEKLLRKLSTIGNLQIDLQDKGVIDSGCSMHMTGNMSYLTYYEEIDAGYVAFRGNPKGGKITRKDKVVSISEGSSETTTERIRETYKNVSQDIRDQLNAEAEAVQIILTGIDNDIYSTVDACPNACKMWKAIERLKQGKAIVNSSQPIYDQEPSMVSKDDETSKDKEIEKLMALISLSLKKFYKPTNNNLRTSSNTSRVNQDNSPRISRGTGYENQRIGNVAGAREIVAYHKEKMRLCKQEEAGIQLNAEQADWRDDTNDEPEDQELEAHYMYMAQI